ncbi:MAG: hypothetical protein ACFCUT_03665 [Kiloniellaceae bacterium]
MSGDRPTYPPEALQRIKRLGENSIVVFFNEIPRESLKVARAILPPLPGFRPGTDAAIQRQVQSLAHRVAAYRRPKSFAHSPEEKALYGLWRAWAESQITERDIVRELFNSLHEETELSDKPEQMATAIKALVVAGTCARETLQQFLLFSPFANIDDFQTFAAGARTAAEIKRDSTLLELPERLHEDEARLQLLEAKINASERDAAVLRSDLEKIGRAVSGLGTKAAEDRATAGELKQTTDHLKKCTKTAEEALARLALTGDQLAQRITGAESQAKVVAESQGGLQRQMADVMLDVSRLSDQMSALDGRFSGLDELVARIDQLESMLLEMAEAKVAKSVTPEADWEAQAAAGPAIQSDELAVVAEKLRFEPDIPIKRLHSVSEILSSVGAALVEAGLRKSMAATFAEELLSALASEQVVFFRGGFAVDLARRCALSLSGAAVVRVAIPLGLTDPSVLRQRLSHRPGFAPDSVASIVIEGVNNSPLDVLRDVLLDQVTYRVGSSGRQNPTVIFASLVDGAGAFPVEPSFLELGPIFDLERMDWRRLRRDKLPALGAVAQDDWRSIAAGWDDKPIDYEEALQGVRQLTRRRNTRVEANVIRAFCALTAIRRESGLTPLQSVTFGWLSPYWESLGAKADDIDAHIDGGKCDGTLVDERLKAFLDDYRCAALEGST